MTELDAAPRRSERALAQQLDGELVLVQVDTGQYYTLNEVGIRVWELCDGCHTVAQVIDRVCEEFDAAHDDVQADVIDLVDTLSSEKLLVTAS